MMETMNKDEVMFIISRLVEKAIDAHDASIERPQDDILFGRKEAYYEMLDVIKSQLEIYDYDLKEFGLDFNLLEKIA